MQFSTLKSFSLKSSQIKSEVIYPPSQVKSQVNESVDSGSVTTSSQQHSFFYKEGPLIVYKKGSFYWISRKWGSKNRSNILTQGRLQTLEHVRSRAYIRVVQLHALLLPNLFMFLILFNNKTSITVAVTPSSADACGASYTGQVDAEAWVLATANPNDGPQRTPLPAWQVPKIHNAPPCNRYT